ncbi:MAG: sulfur carrier protein ThiS [Bacteroidetes bacterium]|nr:sulfur carrier protein ThiS [Bacteroidota bacterium]
MEIKLNHQLKEVASEISVQQLLNDTIGEKQKGIAVSINYNVVPKTTWSQHLVQANDDILIIKATQGG